MQFSIKPACPCKQQKLSGLGFFDDFLLPLASGLMNPGGDGAGAAPGVMVSSNVNPNIQVSPQISPVFQQQFQPSNSPATAGTSQALPGGAGTAMAPMTSPSAGIPMPSAVGVPVDWNKVILIGGAVLGALLVVKMVKGRKTAPKRATRRKTAPVARKTRRVRKGRK